MQIAFNLAKKHNGLTNSNPSVGCVVVKNNKIISSACTEIGGRPHAESIALSDFSKFDGCDLFVTLEPCSHFGKTPPCINFILKAKIKRVFIGVKDTDLRVNGNGILALKNAGVEVIEGVLEDEIKDFYTPYLKAKSRKSPFVSVKIVCSLDGKVATYSNNSKWISDKHSLQYTNFLRHQYDGILIGTQTYLSDNPSLTCRAEGLGEFSPKKFLLSNSIKQAQNYNIISGKFKNFLPKIYDDFGINHLLIEGGAGVITQAFEEGVVDEIFIAFAPFFIGKDGKNSVNFIGLNKVFDAQKFEFKNYFKCGDLIFSILKNRTWQIALNNYSYYLLDY